MFESIGVNGSDLIHIEVQFRSFSRDSYKKKELYFFVFVYVDASFNNYNKHVVPLCSKMGKNVHDYLNSQDWIFG